MEIIGYLIIAFFMFCGIGSKISEECERARKEKEREERYRKRQLRYSRWQRLRHEFDELKKTDQFKRWKNEEYVCQDKKCAWCKNPIGLHTHYTHVDHVVPLFCGGDNSASNLVLTCSSCNKAKGYKTYGYNDSWESDKHNGIGYNAKPSWIAPNKYDDELDKMQGFDNA